MFFLLKNYKGIFCYYIFRFCSNRVVVDESGNMVQAVEYYPSGIPVSKNDLKDNHLHTGKEFESMHGLHWYDNNKRMYDPILCRFTTMDPLCEKYYDTSPYVHCGNNPVNNIDLNGDSISMAQVIISDNVNQTNYVQTTTTDLQSQTGLALNISSTTGQMTYAKNANGQPKIATTIDVNGNVVQVGSATARTALINAINSTDFVNVGINAVNNVSGVPNGSNDIWLSPGQINGFINGATNIDNKTLGWGMTFMHELYHTQVGGGLADRPGNPGPVVTQMNIIRAELNAIGGNYGQRMDYAGSNVGLYNYIPFDKPSQNLLKGGMPPTLKNRYVRFK